MKSPAKAPKRPAAGTRPKAGALVAKRTPRYAVVAPAEPDRNAVRAVADPGKTEALQMAESHLSPAMTNAAVAQRFVSRGLASAIGITEAMEVLTAAGTAVNAKDLSGLQGMLTAQAVSLNTVYAEMARRASLNMGEQLQATDTYLRLAFKAQAQCRATVETLAAVTNPPVVYAKQMNYAAGHQQVNNGSSVAPMGAQPAPSAQAGNGSAPIELLEDQRGKRMDFGTSEEAKQAYSHLATLGAIDRTALAARQGAGKDEFLQGRASCQAGAAIEGDLRRAPRARKSTRRIRGVKR